MSFQSGQIVGQAQDIELKLSASGLGANERQERVLAAIDSVVGEIAREYGGYLAISVTGHVNDYEGGVGDHLNIQVNSILAPPAPVKDAGLDAAGGSARNYPPEASTAAPATEDLSPPAAQEPIPQPADAVPPTPEISSSVDGPALSEPDETSQNDEPQPADSPPSEAEESSDSEEQA